MHGAMAEMAALEREVISPRRGLFRLRNVVLLLVGLYALAVALLVGFENRIVFVPATAAEFWRPSPLTNCQDVTLTSTAGDTIHCWYFPREKSDRVILYSHGNGANLSGWGMVIFYWQMVLDSSVMIYDYPGYGRSSGSPNEAGCYAAAEAAWDWLTTKQNIAPEKIMLVGESLGGAMAIDLALHHPHRALVLTKAFTSIPDMASAMFPWLPGRYLARNHFDNLQKIHNCKGPVFIHHGRRDTLVPFSQGERLFAAAHEPKEFLEEPEGRHDVALPADFFPKLQKFLQQYAPN
jgi:uncharacterized protein